MTLLTYDQLQWRQEKLNTDLVRGLAFIENFQYIATFDGGLQLFRYDLLVIVMLKPDRVAYPLDARTLLLTPDLPNSVEEPRGPCLGFLHLTLSLILLSSVITLLPLRVPRYGVTEPDNGPVSINAHSQHRWNKKSVARSSRVVIRYPISFNAWGSNCWQTLKISWKNSKRNSLLIKIHFVSLEIL